MEGGVGRGGAGSLNLPASLRSADMTPGRSGLATPREGVNVSGCGAARGGSRVANGHPSRRAWWGLSDDGADSRPDAADREAKLVGWTWMSVCGRSLLSESSRRAVRACNSAWSTFGAVCSHVRSRASALKQGTPVAACRTRQGARRPGSRRPAVCAPYNYLRSRFCDTCVV